MTRPGRMKRWWRLVLGPGAILAGAAGAVAWAVRDPWPVRAQIDPPGGQMATARRFAADGSTLLTVGYDGVRAWDVESGRLRGGPTGPAWTDQARSPDGRHFAARVPGTGLAAQVAWGDARSGAVLGRAEAPTFPLGPVAWADEGRTIRVVALGYDRPAWGVVVDLAAGRAWTHAPGATAPEFSPDGRWVVTREPDGTLASRAAPGPMPP